MNSVQRACNSAAGSPAASARQAATPSMVMPMVSAPNCSRSVRNTDFCPPAVT